MAIKQFDLRQNQSVPAGAGLTFDPLLRDMVANVETAVAPDIIIPIPKAAASSAAVTTAMAVGNQTVVHNNVGAIVYDILSIRNHSIQRQQGTTERYLQVNNGTAIANGAGTSIDPLLSLLAVLQIPDVVIPILKVLPALATTQAFVPTTLAVGAINIRHSEAAPTACDILFLLAHTIQRLLTAGGLAAGGVNPTINRNRFFTILNTANASLGAEYTDNADATRRFIVNRAKVSGDGSLSLFMTQIAGATAQALGAGTLNLASGTGDAVINWTVSAFEKYVDIQQNVAVANGAGLTFNPGLCVSSNFHPGTAGAIVGPVMPHIVIPIPKAINTVPFVATDLAGAVGTVNVSHNNGAPINHDILSIRIHTAFSNPNAVS